MRIMKRFGILGSALALLLCSLAIAQENGSSRISPAGYEESYQQRGAGVGLVSFLFGGSCQKGGCCQKPCCKAPTCCAPKGCVQKGGCCQKGGCIQKGGCCQKGGCIQKGCCQKPCCAAPKCCAPVQKGCIQKGGCCQKGGCIQKGGCCQKGGCIQKGCCQKPCCKAPTCCAPKGCAQKGGCCQKGCGCGGFAGIGQGGLLAHLGLFQRSSMGGECYAASYAETAAPLNESDVDANPADDVPDPFLDDPVPTAPRSTSRSVDARR
jgi:hypothetical protein